MLFNSFEFALFLPIVFLLYWFVFKELRWQNLFIVAASYIFYGLWNWKFLFLIALTSFFSYASGIAIEHYADRNTRKCISAINIVLNLLVLGVFKYYNFFVESIQSIAETIGWKFDMVTLSIILPVGISFYTFQALSYTIDVYRKKIKATSNIVEFFAFISFFPQLVAGPIERATNLLPQFQNKRHFNYSLAVDGMRQILWGLFKKIVVADNCALFVDGIYSDIDSFNGLDMLLAGIFFAFQIYGDFSGYSDVAIGTAKLFGIRLRDNFLTPYFSHDIAEFWKRWHISLNKWFVDYVYIPLGGSRVSKIKVLRNVMIIFLLSGLWHGANYTYVCWGFYHAVLFAPLIPLGKNKRYDVQKENLRMLPNFEDMAKMTTTFLFVVFGWIIFRADNIQMAGRIFCKIFSIELIAKPHLWLFEYRIPTFVAIFMCFVLEWINRRRNHGLDINWIEAKYARIFVYYLILMMIVLYSGKNITFIYFQF